MGFTINQDTVSPTAPPKSLSKPIKTDNRTLISGGPSNPYESVQKAFQHPQMGMFEDASIQIMEDIKDGLKYLFQTRNEVTIALTGTGHVAVDTVLDNLLESRDTILVAITGMWGERACDSANRLGAIVKTLKKQNWSAFSLNEIENSIIQYKPNVLYIVNGDSSTGVYQKLEGVGDLCQKYNCLLVVDAVATLGVVPFYVDKWKIDAAFCNSQKGIGAPVGLAPVTFSPRAVSKARNRKTMPSSYRNDMNQWFESNFWNINNSPAQLLHHSYPILLFYTLRQALALIAEETLQNLWVRNENVYKHICQKISELDLEPFIFNHDERLPETILLNPPNGVKPSELAVYFRERHNMELGIGLGPTLNKVIRIAFLGENSNIQKVNQVVSALKDALEKFNMAKKELKN